MEGPDATSPIQRLRKKYGADSISSPASDKSGRIAVKIPRAKVSAATPSPSRPTLRSAKQSPRRSAVKIESETSVRLSPRKATTRAQSVAQTQKLKKPLAIKLKTPAIRLVDFRKKSTRITSVATGTALQRIKPGRKNSAARKVQDREKRKRGRPPGKKVKECESPKVENASPSEVTYTESEKFLVEMFKGATTDEVDSNEVLRFILAMKRSLKDFIKT